MLRGGFGIYYDVVPTQLSTTGVPFVITEPTFNNPATNLSDGNYGRITQTLANAGATQGDITSGGPRIIQLALKLTF